MALDNVFIVGCARSGTTMLQSILSQHSAYASFPETNILHFAVDDLAYRLFGYTKYIGRSRLPRFLVSRLVNELGITFRFSNGRFEKFLAEVDRSDLLARLPRNERKIEDIMRSFVEIMNELSDGRPWIDKSPKNLFCLHLMERYLRDVKFVHIVRDGPDNIASLVDGARKYWAFREIVGHKYMVERATLYWNNAVRMSARYRDRPNHVVVRYEDVVAAPLDALEDVTRLLGVGTTPRPTVPRATLANGDPGGIYTNVGAPLIVVADLCTPIPGGAPRLQQTEERRL